MTCVSQSTPRKQLYGEIKKVNFLKNLFFFQQVKYKTVEPVWEQTFTFFVHNPKRQDLDIEVKLLFV